MTRRTNASKRPKAIPVKRRKVEPEILRAAIKLFGLYGFRGVTTRDVAKEANVVEGSIYGWFKSKEYLYLQAVNAVIADINEEFGKFVVDVFGDSEEVDLARINAGVQAWFASLPQPGARLLMQVVMADDKLNTTARKPLDQFVNIVAKALASQKHDAIKFNPQAAASCLIRALFHTRVVSESQAVAKEDMTQIIQWFSCVMPSSLK